MNKRFEREEERLYSLSPYSSIMSKKSHGQVPKCCIATVAIPRDLNLSHTVKKLLHLKLEDLLDLKFVFVNIFSAAIPAVSG